MCAHSAAVDFSPRRRAQEIGAQAATTRQQHFECACVFVASAAVRTVPTRSAGAAVRTAARRRAARPATQRICAQEHTRPCSRDVTVRFTSQRNYVSWCVVRVACCVVRVAGDPQSDTAERRGHAQSDRSAWEQLSTPCEYSEYPICTQSTPTCSSVRLIRLGTVEHLERRRALEQMRAVRCNMQHTMRNMQHTTANMQHPTVRSNRRGPFAATEPTL